MYLNASAAVSHHRAIPEQTWTLTSAETLMEMLGDPGVTPPTATLAGNTVMYKAALVNNDLFCLYGNLTYTYTCKEA